MAEAPKRILVCDDDETLTDLLAYLLSKEGFEIDIATDGEEALRLLQKKRPHLMILDLDMPTKNGFDVLGEMVHEEDYQSTGVIILSGREREEDIQRALQLGGLAFFTKPFNSVALIQKVKLLLSREAVDG